MGILTQLVIDCRADLLPEALAIPRIVADAKAHAAGTLGDHQDIDPLRGAILKSDDALADAARAAWAQVSADLGDVTILDATRADLVAARSAYREALAMSDGDSAAIALARERLAKARAQIVAIAARVMPEAPPRQMSNDEAIAYARAEYGTGKH